MVWTVVYLFRAEFCTINVTFMIYLFYSLQQLLPLNMFFFTFKTIPEMPQDLFSLALGTYYHKTAWSLSFSYNSPDANCLNLLNCLTEPWCLLSFFFPGFYMCSSVTPLTLTSLNCLCKIVLCVLHCLEVETFAFW